MGTVAGPDAPGEAAQRQRVDARPEHGEQRGQHDHRAERSEPDDSDAGVGEGSQVVEREDEQGGQRGGHRQGGEQDRATGALHGRPHSVGRGHAGVEFLTEPRDDEQAVVDG